MLSLHPGLLIFSPEQHIGFRVARPCGFFPTLHQTVLINNVDLTESRGLLAAIRKIVHLSGQVRTTSVA
jgi:hypothetical protein